MTQNATFQGAFAWDCSPSNLSFLAQMPTGAVGIWAMDGYVTSPRPVVPNLVDSTPVTNSLVGPPRRLFNNAIWWPSQGLTITDSNQTAPDGTSDASTITNAGSNWYIGPNYDDNGGVTFLPPGTYTLAINVKWLGSGSQSFRMGDFTGSQLSTFTATATWKRFSKIVTVTSNSFLLVAYTPDGSSAANLAICDAEVFAGSLDLGPSLLGSHLYFWPMSSSNFAAPAMANGLLDLSNGVNTCYFQLLTSKAINPGAFTIAINTERVAAPKTDSFIAYLADIQGNGAQSFGVGTTLFDTLSPFINNTQIAFSFYQTPPRALDSQGRKLSTKIITYDGSSTLNLYSDGQLVSSTSASAATQSNVDDLFMGSANASDYTGEKYSALALYSRVLNATEIANLTSAFAQKLIANGSANEPLRIVFFEGDSISASVDASIVNNGYVGLTYANSNPIIHGGVFATSGATLSTLTGRASTIDGYLPANKNGVKYCLHVLIGANDLGLGFDYQGNGSGFAAAVLTYIQARQAAGWDYIVVGTVISRTSQADGGTQFDIDRGVYNGIVKGWVGTNINACSDFASNANVGANGAANNATYFNADKIHPIDAGYSQMAPLSETAINGLWLY